MKDLQRQMRQEKKRADKLQERLQEIITHGIPAGGGLEQLLMDHSHEDRQKLDSRSVKVLLFKLTGKVKITCNLIPSVRWSVITFVCCWIGVVEKCSTYHG